MSRKEIVSFHNDLREENKSLVIIDTAHAKIHDELDYTAHINAPTLADGDTIEMYFKAPDSTVRCHVIAAFSSELGGVAEVRRSATVSLSGSVVTIFNSDHNSSNTSTAVVRSSPTVTASGTQFSHFNVGGGFQGRDPGEADSRHEFIAKQGTIYILRYTSIASSNEAEIEVSFYEN